MEIVKEAQRLMEISAQAVQDSREEYHRPDVGGTLNDGLKLHDTKSTAELTTTTRLDVDWHRMTTSHNALE